MTNNLEIITRIEKLEKKNRNLRVVLFAIIGLFFVGGLVAFQTGPQFFKEIKTEKLTIVDKNGKERILLFVDANYAKARFINLNDKPGITIGSKKYGYIVSNEGAYLSFKAKGQKSCYLDEDVLAFTNYRDKDTAEVITIMNDGGNPKLILRNSKGKPRFLVQTSDWDNEVSMHFFSDASKNPDGSLSGPFIGGRSFFGVKDIFRIYSTKNESFLDISDNEGNRRIQLGSFTNPESTGLQIYDRNGGIRALYGSANLTSNGRKQYYNEANIWLFNKNGNSIWSAP